MITKGKYEEIKKTHFIKEWKKEMRLILKTTYPNAKDKHIEKFLEAKIRENIKIEQAKLYNNYENVEYKTDTIQLVEFIHKTKPITNESGVLFDPTANNPAAKMLLKLRKKRSAIKKEMFNLNPDSLEYRLKDLSQNTIKRIMNSWYGVSGNKTCAFFNLHCALSTTIRGQALISTAAMAFENFMSGNVKFRNNDECMVFIKNVVKEKNNRKFIDDYTLDHDVHPMIVFNKLKNTYENKGKCNDSLIYNMLTHLNKEDLNRIYYKNNLYEFCRTKCMKEKLRALIIKADVFNNPAEVPEDIQDDLDELWELLQEYVHYNYMILDRTGRLRYKPRESVLVIDTDSNMVNMKPWYEFMINEVMQPGDELGKDATNYRHSILYTLAYFLGLMINETLMTFGINCNIPEDKRHFLNMKNEFLFSRMIITNGKKNYASLVEFREGNPVYGKLDTKGIQIGKTSTNKNASSMFKDILKNDILKTEKIEIPEIMKRLNDFEHQMKEDVKNGSPTYIKPARVKPFDSYPNPFGQQTVKAVHVWNSCYPEKELIPPITFFIVKIKPIKKIEELDYIKRDYPKIHEALLENVFNHPILKKEGLKVMAIPREEAIPDWVKPIIAIDTIVADNMGSFLPILEALDIQRIYSANNKSHYSNIVQI